MTESPHPATRPSTDADPAPGRTTRRRLLTTLALGAAALPATRAAGPDPREGASGAAPGVGGSSTDPAPGGLEEVPYVQTPDASVDAMLELAQVGPGDTLLDLGSGDGRVVIRAAARFGVPGLGVEIDPNLVALSRQRAQAAGVAALARFATQDLFDTDLTRATVITLYLLPDVNLALRPRLLRLAPGTRIVSHDWDMADWLPDRSVVVAAPGKPVGLRKESQLHRWTVPASIQGEWLGRVQGTPDDELAIRITQQFQRFGLHWRASADRGRGLSRLAGADGRLLGRRAGTTLEGAQGRFPLTLEAVAGDRIEGTVGTPAGERRWWAQRIGLAERAG